jgi:hypothetical protein
MKDGIAGASCYRHFKHHATDAVSISALNLASEKSNRGDSAFMQESISVEGSESSSSRRKLPVVARRPRTIAPFIFSYDASRGAFHALQTLLSYVLMLAVMYVITLAAPADHCPDANVQLGPLKLHT